MQDIGSKCEVTFLDSFLSVRVLLVSPLKVQKNSLPNESRCNWLSSLCSKIYRILLFPPSPWKCQPLKPYTYILGAEADEGVLSRWKWRWDFLIFRFILFSSSTFFFFQLSNFLLLSSFAQEVETQRECRRLSLRKIYFCTCKIRSEWYRAGGYWFQPSLSPRTPFKFSIFRRCGWNRARVGSEFLVWPWNVHRISVLSLTFISPFFFLSLTLLKMALVEKGEWKECCSRALQKFERGKLFIESSSILSDFSCWSIFEVHLMRWRGVGRGRSSDEWALGIENWKDIRLRQR